MSVKPFDPHKFKQVLYNLLSDAAKFANDNGAVEISGSSSATSCRVTSSAGPRLSTP